MSSRVSRGYASMRSASEAPSLSLRRMSSTGIRVPPMTGFPSITRGFISMRSVNVMHSLVPRTSGLAGSKFQHRRDVFGFEIGVAGQDLFARRARSQEIEDIRPALDRA